MADKQTHRVISYRGRYASALLRGLPYTAGAVKSVRVHTELGPRAEIATIETDAWENIQTRNGAHGGARPKRRRNR